MQLCAHAFLPDTEPLAEHEDLVGVELTQS